MAAAAPVFQYRGTFKTAKIPPCKLSIDDLRRMHAELANSSRKATETLIANAKQPADVSQEDFEARKAAIRAAAGPVVRVYGSNGEQASGLSADILDDLPEQVSEIQFDSAAALQTGYNVLPLNRFNVIFDFSEPPLLGSNDAANEPTPNKSAVTVLGDDTDWVRGVYSYVMSFVEDRKRKRNWAWLHSPVTFNWSLLLLALPAAIWLGHRVDSFVIERWPGSHVIVRAAVFLYTVLLALRIWQVMLGTLRWAFPVVEIEGSRTWKTRTVVVTFVGGLLLVLVRDVFSRLVLE